MVVKNKNNDDSSCEGVNLNTGERGRGATVKQTLVKKKKESTKAGYDLDIRNTELLIDMHSSDPFGVMRIQSYDSIPMAKETDDVVIRVLVSLIYHVEECLMSSCEITQM